MPNVDAIPGARFKDTMLDAEGIVAGVYEATDFEDGEPVGTSVYVDLLYDDDDDPIRVPLDAFKGDSDIEIEEVPNGVG